VPENLIEELPATSLPADWRSIAPTPSTQRLGNSWLASRSAVGLLVPSILITGAAPEVKNCLINPEHPEFKQVTLKGPILLALDSRFAG
jgi:RES domain-containing protein